MLMYILSVFILFMQFVKYVQVCLASYFITAHVILHFTLFMCNIRKKLITYNYYVNAQLHISHSLHTYTAIKTSILRITRKVGFSALQKTHVVSLGKIA